MEEGEFIRMLNLQLSQVFVLLLVAVWNVLLFLNKVPRPMY